jgi:hypothetical protein
MAPNGLKSVIHRENGLMHGAPVPTGRIFGQLLDADPAPGSVARALPAAGLAPTP